MPKHKKNPFARTRPDVLPVLRSLRRITKRELAIVRKRIRLLPRDALVETQFFFGAAYWASLSAGDRQAIGQNFMGRWERGEFPELALRRTKYSVRWHRAD